MGRVGENGTVTTADVAPIADRPETWSAVVGQGAAVDQLRAASANPVHAYLLVGPAGCGKRAAASAFAGVLLAADAAARDADPARALALALDETHPDLLVFEPEGASLSVRDAEEITRSAHRSPVEGSRKVLVLTEFEKVAQAGPALLKTIEEPPASTVFVVLAEEVPPELVPIASRAARIDFGPVPEMALVERLVAEGADDDVATAAAAAAGGDMRRARLLVGDRSLAVRRDAWASLPRRVDGTGHTATQLVDEVVAHIDAAQEALDERQRREHDDLVAQIETYGQPKTLLKEQETRHKREVRRHRTAELRFGLATMAGTYRDALAVARDPSGPLAALDAIQAAAEAWVRNPNELLLLQSLVAGFEPV